MGMTFAQKILARAAGLDHVVPGQIVAVKPDHLLTHDNTAAIFCTSSSGWTGYPTTSSGPTR